MYLRLCLLFVVGLIASGIPERAEAGPLQEVEDTAKGPGPERPEREAPREERKPASHHAHHAYGTPGGSTSDEGDSGIGMLFLYVLLAPWSLPYALLDDPCFARFAPYPYADGRGHLRPWIERADCAETGLASGRRSAIQTEFEGGYVLHHVVAGSVGARVQFPRRMELLGRITYRNDLRARPHEQALGGTLNLAVRFAQSRSVDFRTGLGLRAFALHEALYGVDFMYGMDVYGEHPIMAHLELHAGMLGHAGSAQARLTVGVQLWKLELYAGYDHTVFWREDQKTRLGGPVLGLRAWF